MITLSTILTIGAIIIVTLVVLILIRRMASDKKIKAAHREANKAIDKANREAHHIVKKAHNEAQDIANKSRRECENEIKERRRTISEIEKTLNGRESQLENRERQLIDSQESLKSEIRKYEALIRKEEDRIVELSTKLETIAGLSKEDAEKQLLENVEREARKKAGKLIKSIEEQSKKIANRRAKEIVTDAIQRTAVDHVAPITTSSVMLPDDEMKGRVIGKEGRNIRAFEAATGVDVIIDDTPGAVVLSAFDPIRREIAKMAMEHLIQDGRIHPTRIEEAIEQARAELNDIILERGEKAADEVGLSFHPKIIEYLGKLYYRTSYGQNILMHSLESAHIAGIMAGTLGVNVNLAKRGALLHDIGKAIDFEQEGSHTDLGKDICEKYGESDEVINCIMAHHEDEDPDTIEAILVMMADAMSSVRPGARRESLETYIKRLEKLEGLANSFKGVDKAYAIQAGREVRVLVKPEEVDDDAAAKLAFDMANKIEEELDYPGEVKVSVVRETRSVGVAR